MSEFNERFELVCSRCGKVTIGRAGCIGSVFSVFAFFMLGLIAGLYFTSPNGTEIPATAVILAIGFILSVYDERNIRKEETVEELSDGVSNIEEKMDALSLELEPAELGEGC